MDALSEVLRTARVRRAAYRRIEATAPWGAEVAAWEHPLVYAVLAGGCVLRVDGGEEIAFTAGDVVVLAAGRPHTFRDRPASRPLPFPALLRRYPVQPDGTLRLGGDGGSCTLLVAELQFERPDSDALLSGLPPVMRVPAGPGPSPGRAVLEVVLSELEAPAPGNDAVLGRLADVLFVHAVRGHLGCGDGWLRALTDPLLAPVVAAMHRSPERPWTTEALAREGALSRSAFAERFARILGEPPLRHLTRIRMHRAAHLLGTGSATVRQTARAVGYETEASFSKAFLRWYGVRPGGYRHSVAVAARGSVPAAPTEVDDLVG